MTGGGSVGAFGVCEGLLGCWFRCWFCSWLRGVVGFWGQQCDGLVVFVVCGFAAERHVFAFFAWAIGPMKAREGHFFQFALYTGFELLVKEVTGFLLRQLFALDVAETVVRTDEVPEVGHVAWFQETIFEHGEVQLDMVVWDVGEILEEELVGWLKHEGGTDLGLFGACIRFLALRGCLRRHGSQAFASRHGRPLALAFEPWRSFGCLWQAQRREDLGFGELWLWHWLS